MRRSEPRAPRDQKVQRAHGCKTLRRSLLRTTQAPARLTCYRPPNGVCAPAQRSCASSLTAGFSNKYTGGARAAGPSAVACSVQRPALTPASSARFDSSPRGGALRWFDEVCWPIRELSRWKPWVHGAFRVAPAPQAGQMPSAVLRVPAPTHARAMEVNIYEHLFSSD